VKPDVAGPDKIYNGAVDNGMGCSQILDIAEKFRADKRPQRTLAFIFWAMEEQGLLGSEYFAGHQLWPRTHIAGVLNIDADGPSPATRDMVVRGGGQSEIEDMLADALKTQNRFISPDPQPEKGSFYRSDHFSLAKVGIPAISASAGWEDVVGGAAAGKARSDEYLAHYYHQPTDEWQADWDLTATTADAYAYYIVGDTLANSDRWPGWKEGSEFKAIRDKDMAAKK
jgi:Zn-dependent M28 family amino/carboxypeptidase